MLRHFQCIAMRREHNCHKCIHPIVYGESYCGRVMVNGRQMYVEREHIWCPDPERDYEMYRKERPETVERVYKNAA